MGQHSWGQGGRTVRDGHVVLVKSRRENKGRKALSQEAWLWEKPPVPKTFTKQGMVMMMGSQGQMKTFRDLDAEKITVPQSSRVIQNTPVCTSVCFTGTQNVHA